ncbi:hypothetical protein K439DRAFT_1664032 [Ramaria rubella]|nr:hypothetical protein K439DRAFT_1664032 [Ramaria rubella]
MFNIPSSQPESSIFIALDGEPLRFFVEAAAVRERPKLIRKIIKNGGAVVSAAREADILLAESNTKEALELLEAWSAGKVLLSTRWVSRCIDEGKFIGADCGWTGYELTRKTLLESFSQDDDGVGDDEDVDELPAKRAKLSHTPKSSQVLKSSRPTVSPQVSKPSPSKNPRTPVQESSRLTRPNKAPRSSSPATNSSGSSNTLDSRLPTNHFTQSPMLPMDTANHPLFPGPSQQQGALLPTMYNPLLQPSQQQLSPEVLATLGQFSAFTPFPTNPYSGFLNPQSLQQLKEAVQYYELQQAAFGAPSNQPTQTSAPLDQIIQAPSARLTPEDAVDLISEDASVRSEEAQVELVISDRRRKGKRRALNAPSSDSDVQTAVRSNPPGPKLDVSNGKKGIFTDGQGFPKNIYAMVDLKNRKDLLKIVRKHGGKMVSQMNDADYIVLNNRSPQFQNTLNILPHHKIAISPTWLEECDKANRLVELADHTIDVTSGVGKGAAKQKPATKPRSSKQGDIDCGNEEGNHMPKPISAMSMAGPHDGEPSNLQLRSRSPSPPREFVAHSEGKFLYSEKDHEWFFRYARYKLERNPHMSLAALAEAVALKAPYHSAKSWENAWRTKWAAEMKSLQQEMLAFRSRTQQGLGLTPPSKPYYLPQTPGSNSSARGGELVYPSSSPSYPPANSNQSLSTNTSNPHMGPPATPPLKRMQNSIEVPTVNQYGKRAAMNQDVIDVDLFPDVWLEST